MLAQRPNLWIFLVPVKLTSNTHHHDMFSVEGHKSVLGMNK